MGEVGRHAVLSLGFALARTEDGDSPRLGLDLLEKAPDHALRVAEALGEFRYVPYSTLMPDCSADGGDLVERAVIAENIDVLVVHIVGHGEVAEGSSEKLYVLDGNGERLSRPVGAWIDRIEDHPERHRPVTLFVLDVCYAGEVAVTSWHARMDVANRRAWVLAATGPKDQAFGYRLSRALVSVLGKYRDREVRFDPSVRYIPPGTVWREIERTVNELVVRDGGLPQTVLTSLVPGHVDLSHLPFFPNPSFDPAHRAGGGTVSGLPGEIARLADWAADPEHFMRRAGGAEPVDRDWDEGYFSGRTEELRILSSWLDDEAAAPGLRVVTGKPGVGKSALLGVLVCASHPALRRHTRHLWRGLGNRAPGKNERIVVVHARRLGVEQIVASLARQLRNISDPAGRLSGPDEEREGSAGNPVDRLLGLLPGDGRPVTVIVDALDEAVRPQDVTAELVVPLAQRAQAPGSGLRLLVGTRDDERFHSLLALARDEDACTDLSAAAPESVCRAVTEYVRRLLAADGAYAPGYRRAAREALARAIADKLTGTGGGDRPAVDTKALEWGEFLTAGLYIHYLLASEEPRESPEAAAELGRAVPRSLPALMELDLRRHTGRPLLHAVLSALAFAQGRGMPEHVLAHTAAAFTTVPTDDGPLPLQEVYALLDREARFYLRRDVDEDGTTLYRLFHEGLADWLRHHPPHRRPARHEPPTTGEEQGPAEIANSAAPGAGPAEELWRPRAAERLYEQLLNSVPRDGAGQRLWHLAAPYLWRHTAQHALDAGHLDDLLQDSGFLVYADPHALADALSRAGSEQARLNAAVYRASWGVHHALLPAARRQILALDAARFRNQHMQADLPGDSDWHVRWATGIHVSTELVRTFIGHTGWVHSVAVTELGGRPHAVTGSNDGSVRLWDLTTGNQTRQLTRRSGAVVSVAVAKLEGKPHALIAGDGGSMRLWDLTTGNQTRQLTRRSGAVVSVAVAKLEGKPHALIAGDGGSMRLWDLTTEDQIQQPTGPPGTVISVAVAELDGRPHAVTAGDGGLRVWDLTLADRTRTRKLIGHSGWFYSVAVTELDGRPHAVAGSNDGSVRLWDLTTGFQTRQLTGHTGPVTSVAVAELDGRPHALASSRDGAIWVWDLTTGDQTRQLTGHTGPVTSMTVAELDGRPHALASSRDAAIWVWDLTTGDQTRQLTGHTGEITSMTVAELNGHSHAITASIDGTLRVWDLTTRDRTRQFAGRTGWIHSVAVAELNGRPHAVTAADNGLVRVWDLTTGDQTRQLTGHTGPVKPVVVAELDGRPHAVTAGDSGSMWVWDLTTGGRTRLLTGYSGWIHSVAVAELNGRPHAVTASDSGSMWVWDLTTGERTRQLTGHSGWIHSVAVAELDGRPHAITGGHDGALRVWDLTTRKQTHKLIAHTGAVNSVVVAELDGRPHAVTADDDGALRVWDLTTGDQTRQLTGHTGEVTSVAVAELDGRPHAVTADDDGALRVWDLTTGSCLTTYRLPAVPSAVTVTPDGTVVLGVGHDVVVLSLAPLYRRLL
ncbi:WD40 repeat domain-containing protein [Streptomyces sp. NBC_01725]|uniref:WD40 repeat domain-containing protein n=1 Tax=Streptomyces sp. NBC_01725 TaxID=2975923 RepID=UPI002E2A1A32|nr:WD40 repeat domain-containing protein [Streptomyces sp. NBC_01725]